MKIISVNGLNDILAVSISGAGEMTERDIEATLAPDADDPVALAFRHYLLALRAHKAKKTLLSMQSLVSETEELVQQTLPVRKREAAPVVELVNRGA